MKRDLLKTFEHIPYFTIVGFKQVINADESENQRVREMLSRWMKKGHIIQLKRGVYMTRRFYEIHRNDASFAPAVSAILLPQSYVSLEYILQRSGVLTEVTYPITAITIKNKKKAENIIGTFMYRHIRRLLYEGFRQLDYYGVAYGEASVAKALFDFLYLRPLPRSVRTQRYHIAEELRLNVDDFSNEEIEEFAYYAEKCNTAKMDFIFENLRRTVWRL